MSLLAAKDLRFGYDAKTAVVDGWSAEFQRGEMVSITGPSGRGKSTLLYLLALMLRAQSGEVLVSGRPTSSLSDAGLTRLRAHHFGFVFQDAALDSTRTVLDNVIEPALYRGTSRGEARTKALELLERFNVAIRAHAKPGQVSGGQAQRIALVRALLNSPPIVLADEPTGNLDAATGALVMGALRTHARSGAAVIIVTHDPGLVSQCDRSIRL